MHQSIREAEKEESVLEELRKQETRGPLPQDEDGLDVIDDDDVDDEEPPAPPAESKKNAGIPKKARRASLAQAFSLEPVVDSSSANEATP